MARTKLPNGTAIKYIIQKNVPPHPVQYYAKPATPLLRGKILWTVDLYDRHIWVFNTRSSAQRLAKRRGIKNYQIVEQIKPQARRLNANTGEYVLAKARNGVVTYYAKPGHATRWLFNQDPETVWRFRSPQEAINVSHDHQLGNSFVSKYIPEPPSSAPSSVPDSVVDTLQVEVPTGTMHVPRSSLGLPALEARYRSAQPIQLYVAVIVSERALLEINHTNGSRAVIESLSNNGAFNAYIGYDKDEVIKKATDKAIKYSTEAVHKKYNVVVGTIGSRVKPKVVNYVESPLR